MGGQPAGTVTLLFTDIEGSTRLLERLGPERYRESLELHRRVLRGAFERHNGYEVDCEGDAFFVAFTSAALAVAAAAEAQEALAAADWVDGLPIRVRMGIHTGEPLLAPPKYVGLDVHKAARVMSAGHGGQVLLTKATYRLLGDEVEVRELGTHRLKDLLQPEPIYQLQLTGLRQDFPALKTLGNRPNNLPVVSTPFIGRTRELATARELLEKAPGRLLTMTGTGGIGKTRLALQVAGETIEQFRDGVYWVPLAALREPRLLAATVAQTLGLPEDPDEPVEATLSRYLVDKQLLLALDNVEHLIDAGRQLVATLLAAAPDLRIITTTREALRVSAEQLYEVPPLTLPAGDPAAEHPDAVQLFVSRARAADSEFVLTAVNTPVVGEIVCRLEGLPLAIELAAARLRAFTPAALLERLDSRLRLLTVAPYDADHRQQTLRATIQWSYELLAAPERELFVRLGVFIGGSRLEAVVRICGLDPDRDSADTIESLIAKSLVRRRDDDDGQPRYWMLETIREFAEERLAESVASADDVRSRFTSWVADTVEESRRELRGSEQLAAYSKLDREYPNVRAALERLAADGDDGQLCRIVAAAWRYWYMRGRLTEGRSWIEAALARAAEQPPRVRATILVGATAVAGTQGDHETAASYVDQAIDLCRELDDPVMLSGLLRDRAIIAQALGVEAGVDRDLAEAYDVAVRSSDKLTIAGARLALASRWVAQRQFDLAAPALQDALTTFAELSDAEGRAWTLTAAGHAALLQSLDAQAAARYVEAADIAQRHEFTEIAIVAMMGMAVVLQRAGDIDAAAALTSAATSAALDHGIVPSPLERQVGSLIDLEIPADAASPPPLDLHAATTLARARSELLRAHKSVGRPGSHV